MILEKVVQLVVHEDRSLHVDFVSESKGTCEPVALHLHERHPQSLRQSAISDPSVNSNFRGKRVQLEEFALTRCK